MPAAKKPAAAKGRAAKPAPVGAKARGAAKPAKAPAPRKAPATTAKAQPREDIEHGGSKLIDRDLPNALTPDEEAFITAYLANGLNGTAAALVVHPNLSPLAAAVKASRLIKVGKIRARIKSERQRIAASHETSRDELLGALMAIVRADPNELTSMRSLACPFCWGGGGTKPEAGPGLRVVDPDPECPSCAGEGDPQLHIADTRKLSADGSALFAGIHQTKDGIRILTHSKLDAIEKAAKMIGAYEADNRQKADALGELLGRIGKSAFPVARDVEGGSGG